VPEKSRQKKGFFLGRSGQIVVKTARNDDCHRFLVGANKRRRTGRLQLFTAGGLKGDPVDAFSRRVLSPLSFPLGVVTA
jgi:hypothetical protein